MQCPYCHTPLLASTNECLSCRLTFARTESLLGVLPRLTPTISDTTRSLRPQEHVRIRRRIEQIQRRFPQVVLQVVMNSFPQTYSLQLYTFWLFNGTAIAGKARRGKHNHALLLLIDPDRGEAAIMPGYGLEPFLKTGALDHLLDLAGPAWSAGEWAEGIEQVLDGLDKLLESEGTFVEDRLLSASDF